MQGTRACASERDVGDVITKKQCCVKEILSAGPLLQGSGLKPRTGGWWRRRRGLSGNILWRDPLLNSLYHLDSKCEFPLRGNKLTPGKFYKHTMLEQ